MNYITQRKSKYEKKEWKKKSSRNAQDEWFNEGTVYPEDNDINEITSVLRWTR